MNKPHNYYYHVTGCQWRATTKKNLLHLPTVTHSPLLFCDVEDGIGTMWPFTMASLSLKGAKSWMLLSQPWHKCFPQSWHLTQHSNLHHTFLVNDIFKECKSSLQQGFENSWTELWPAIMQRWPSIRPGLFSGRVGCLPINHKLLSIQ